MKRSDVLDELKDYWNHCTDCSLSESRTHVVFGEGNPVADVLFLAESPGKQEDAMGRPFMGKSGSLLMEFYVQCSYDKRLEAMRQYSSSAKGEEEIEDPFNVDTIRQVFLEEVYVTNVLGCRPTSQGSQLEDDWVYSCRPRIDEIIYQVDPLVMVAVGRHAFRALIGKTIPIKKNMGKIFIGSVAGRRTTLHYPVIPVIHPASFFHQQKPEDWEEGGLVFQARDAVKKAFWLADSLSHAYTGKTIPTRGTQ